MIVDASMRSGGTPRRATVHDLRRRNRAKVFERLLRDGESTRGLLADACDLSAATLANIISDLVRDGLVEESGSLPSDGGRPIARLVPRAGGAYLLGADVGEHGISVETFDLRLRSVHHWRVRLRPSEFQPRTIREALADAIADLRRSHPQEFALAVGMGLGLPGIVEDVGGPDLLVSSQSLGWPPLGLSEFIPEVDLPVLAENGAKTMAAAETWAGPARTSRHCVTALVGRGVGAGVVEDGQLLRGATGSAGEWGHTKVTVQGRRCSCGGQGCLEAYIGAAAILRRWAEVGGRPSGDDEADIDRLLQLADDGDVGAASVVEETVDVLGLGLANLVNLLNPDVIVLGGWVGRAIARERLDEVRSAMVGRALDQPGRAAELRLSRLGEEAVSLGAALLPLRRLISGDLVAREEARRGGVPAS